METSVMDLRAALERFEFDEPGTSFPFERRLARENGWSPGFTRRVIGEYRRFLLLSAVAGHPISPSDEVDQAWHLHLTYTRSYWQRLCRDVLRFPLHHEPTRGGTEEGAKFVDWYERTLASYRSIFGEEPPPDVWPPVRERFRPARFHRRVEARAHWILARPRWDWPDPRWWKSAAAILLGTAAVGCTTLYRTYPFNLDGGHFLSLFLFLASTTFVLAALLRVYLKNPSSGVQPDAETEDPYLIAHLAGGHARAVQAAVVGLAARGNLRTNSSRELYSTDRGAGGTHPLERAIHTTLSPASAQTLRSVTIATSGLGTILREELIRRGWWCPDHVAARARWLPLLLALLVPGVGLTRSIQGISRGYASEYIVILTFGTLVVALVGFARRPGRNLAGSRVLRQLRARHSALNRKTRRAPTVQAAGTDACVTVLPLAIGLFGSSVLANTPLDHLRRTLQPADTSASGCATSSASGCSAGGGDGGGDGGGGGCGGCGGGGGGD